MSRTQRLFTLVFSLLLLTAGSAMAQVFMEMEEAELIAAKGKPVTKAVVGDKAIYRWPDMEVTLRKGKVTAFKVRDPEVERLEEVRRLRAIEEAKAREAAWAATPQPRLTPATATYTPKTALQLATERANRAARIAGLKGAIEGQRQIIDGYSNSFSNPHVPRTSSEARESARAQIVQYEAEIQQLEAQQQQQW